MVALDQLVVTLNDNPTVTIELASHTDARGGAAHNMELSQKRAQSVVNYLIEKRNIGQKAGGCRIWQIKTKDR
jgi:peptidoglycan-associated lipoprotein